MTYSFRRIRKKRAPTYDQCGADDGPVAAGGCHRYLSPERKRRGILAKLYVLLFGTPHLGTFANGIYLRRTTGRMTPSSVLDAGCGDGTLAFYMASRFPKARVLGVDIGEQGLHASDSTLDICARVHRSLPLATWNSGSWTCGNWMHGRSSTSHTASMCWSTLPRTGRCFKISTGRYAEWRITAGPHTVKETETHTKPALHQGTRTLG
jgi:hypothetical protein